MEEGAYSFAHLGNVSLLEEMYQKYVQDPSKVDPSWRYFFEGMSFAAKEGRVSSVAESGDLRIFHLIEAYRKYGHLGAYVNPIGIRPDEPQELSLQRLGFSGEERGQEFPTCGFLPEAKASLDKMIDALKKTYCGSIGIEYVGMGSEEVESWLQRKIEPYFPISFASEAKLEIYHYLNKAELFESFIHTKYVGQKRFSLEGGETLIPMLVALLNQGSIAGMKEAVIGMAHRGRLNVLANILNKSYAQIFHEFEDHYVPDLLEGTGDVKYHKGFHGSLTLPGGSSVEVILAANPSHLEAVSAVVEGLVRAKQELKNDEMQRKTVVPILIHGDSSVAGQGVVYETLQLSKLEGYTTGGTIHLVVNNQIGFTTVPKESRSTRYCTDIARAFGSPVLHVNAEDPECCVQAAILAIELRQRFHIDVFIDINCYRKYGHNEGDEPTFTQPLEYKRIREKKTIREIYKDKLVEQGVIDQKRADYLEEEFKQSLSAALFEVSSLKKDPSTLSLPAGKETLAIESHPLQVTGEMLRSLASSFCLVPEGFNLHPKIARLIKERLAMVEDIASKKKVVDWGMAEHLSFACLLFQGVHIRLSGQDSRRGTFSHRHAVFVDQTTEARYFPLNHLAPMQASFHVFNSPLSEFAVMGFDLGYSFSYPDSLTIWEAQFGDFANGAQIIIDQFLSAAEQKWNVRSNLTLLLPHGYEGQGPEHSSARMERFLQLSAESNFIIANCTTPAQFFHLLRRQAFLTHKRPLVVFTPKALLRHPLCVSSIDEFIEGEFVECIDDTVPADGVEKILLCSGKVYYDLIQEREKRKKGNVAIIRIEQLYPLPVDKITSLPEKYRFCKTICYVQEEHSNMGAWEYIHPFLEKMIGKKALLRYVGRSRSAASAAGSYALHKKQLETILNEAFTD